jgi:hypothetical protein
VQRDVLALSQTRKRRVEPRFDSRVRSTLIGSCTSRFGECLCLHREKGRCPALQVVPKPRINRVMVEGLLGPNERDAWLTELPNLASALEHRGPRPCCSRPKFTRGWALAQIEGSGSEECSLRCAISLWISQASARGSQRHLWREAGEQGGKAGCVRARRCPQCQPSPAAPRAKDVGAEPGFLQANPHVRSANLSGHEIASPTLDCRLRAQFAAHAANTLPVVPFRRATRSKLGPRMRDGALIGGLAARAKG